MRPGEVKKRIWREVRQSISVEMPDGTVHRLEPGMFAEEAVFRHVKADRARVFGPTYDDGLLGRVFGFAAPEPGQVLLDGRTEPRRLPQMRQYDKGPKTPRPAVEVVGPPMPPPPPGRPVEPRAVLVDRVRALEWVFCRDGLPPPAPVGFASEAVVIVAEWDTPCVDLPDAAISECLRCLDETGAAAVVPVSNIGHPIAAPTGKDEGRSSAMRLPGGRSPSTIAHALLDAAPAHTRIVSGDFGAIVVRASAVADYVAGRLTADRVVTCLTAFAWRRPGSPALPPLAGTPTPSSDSPAVLVHPIREAVARVRNPGLPVVFVCDGVGPVGGTQVLLNLVDALNDTGEICASLVHEFRGSYPHRFRSRTAPVPLTRAELVNAIEDRLGWTRGERGIVIGTSWGTGDKVREICARRHHLIPGAFWQDREDLFERPDGRPCGVAEFGAYLSIPRAVSVSRWVAETARTEAGAVAHATVIPPAVDPDSASDGSERPATAAVRVLAMWRPMTAIRRGMPRLAALYTALRKRYRARVSLELFGWPEDAPKACDVHHGVLDTRGVAALMQAVDVVVEPSEYQGFGLTGLEAIAGGACLVSTACRGVDEYAIHERNALVVAHADLEAAVCRVIDDAVLRAQIMRGALESSIADWSDTAQQWVSVLKSWAASAD